MSKSKQKPVAYVLDTNTIIENPAFLKTINDKIILTTTALQELDKNKYIGGEKSRNIREFARYVSRKIEEKDSNIIIHNSDSYKGTNDEKIIETCSKLSKSFNIILLTNDILMRCIARGRKVYCQSLSETKTSQTIDFTGVIDIRSVENKDGVIENMHPNEYALANTGLCVKKGTSLKRVSKDREIWGVVHKNLEQKCAMDAMLDDDIKLVTISGKAGTGKTLLAIAVALDKVVNQGVYEKIIVARPVVPMGNEVGFLPGDLSEKLRPWMQPIFDNLEYLFSKKDGKDADKWMELEQRGILKIEALTYIRGRSIPDQFIIIDEAQNLSKHEIKTIISRAGENTKIILTGDVDQIDNPKLDKENNGLSHVIEKFKNEPIAAHIHLSKCERSELADKASELL